MLSGLETADANQEHQKFRSSTSTTRSCLLRCLLGKISIGLSLFRFGCYRLTTSSRADVNRPQPSILLPITKTNFHLRLQLWQSLQLNLFLDSHHILLNLCFTINLFSLVAVCFSEPNLS
jgi:hypothetical protein